MKLIFRFDGGHFGFSTTDNILLSASDLAILEHMIGSAFTTGDPTANHHNNGGSQQLPLLADNCTADSPRSPLVPKHNKINQNGVRQIQLVQTHPADKLLTPGGISGKFAADTSGNSLLICIEIAATANLPDVFPTKKFKKS